MQSKASSSEQDLPRPTLTQQRTTRPPPDHRANLISAVPGRSRLRVRGLYRNPSLKQRLERDLAGKGIFTSISANTMTGTLLLEHQPGSEPAQVRRMVEQAAGNDDRFSQASSSDQSSSRESSQGSSQEASQGASQAALPNQSSSPAQLQASPKKAPGQTHPQTHPQTSPQPPWHTQDTRTALRRLDTHAVAGLPSAEAHARKRHYGSNDLPVSAMRSRWSMLREQFLNLPVGLLSASAIISLLTRARLDAGIIMAVVALNGLIGFRTEHTAESIISGLRQLGPQNALVRRDRKRRRLPQKELVPGDVLLLTPGESVAADARLLNTNNLYVDESALTGESLPVRKRAILTTEPDTPLAERRNMVYKGTSITGGNGIALVTGTAGRTELGRIQQLAESAETPQTPMQRELNRVGTNLVYLGMAVGIVSIGISLLRGRASLDMLNSNVTLAVAAIPEGLPTVATSALALGIRRLRRRHAAVRRIDAVESLGAITSICLDKTGTLTFNRMCVTEIVSNRRHSARDGHLKPALERLDPGRDTATIRLLQTAALCIESAPGPQSDWRHPQGSATEKALLQTALDAGIDIDELHRQLPRIHVRLRSEDAPYMATFHQTGDGGRLVAVKGSPETVLELCGWRLTHSGPEQLDCAARQEIIRENQRMAGSGLRVLGVARSEEARQAGVRQDHGQGAKADDNASDQSLPELTWLGLVGMTDPIRPDVEALMARFHRAGIRTVMITGDQRETADAIGKQLHLSGDNDLHTLEVGRLDSLSAEALQREVRDVDVFARVSPADKLRVVRALQQAGEVVAMTGDGINDGPALRAADVGIALGLAGTDAARSMADMVIEDDNLDTILTAVEGGRTIFSNIRKAILFLLSTNFSEIQLMLAGIVMDIGRPLTTMQLLWINLVTDIFPGLALALEPPEPDLLRRPPRDPGSAILERGDIRTMARESALMASSSLAAYLIGRLRQGRKSDHSGNTFAFTTLTISQMLHAYRCRSETESIFRSSRPANRSLNLAVGGSLALQLLAPQVPQVRRLLGLSRIGLLDTLVILAMAAVPVLINDQLKPGLERRPGIKKRNRAG